MQSYALRLIDVAYIYGVGQGPLEALAEVSLCVSPGEFVSFVGPSGCGKTTLLRLIAGLEAPTGGRIEMPNDDGRVGFVFQSGALMPWRTVLGNVMLPMELEGGHRREMTARARTLTRLVGLEGFEEAYPRQLSGGMQQRVALARALAHDPALLLLDEPFAALDALSRERMDEELQRIWMLSRNTVLMVTHSIEESLFLSDRVVVLSQRPGRIKGIFPVSFERPRMAAVRYSPEFASLAAQVRQSIEVIDTDAALVP